jgi:hypothetical protein
MIDCWNEDNIPNRDRQVLSAREKRMLVTASMYSGLELADKSGEEIENAFMHFCCAPEKVYAKSLENLNSGSIERWFIKKHGKPLEDV